MVDCLPNVAQADETVRFGRHDEHGTQMGEKKHARGVQYTASTHEDGPSAIHCPGSRPDCLGATNSRHTASHTASERCATFCQLLHIQIDEMAVVVEGAGLNFLANTKDMTAVGVEVDNESILVLMKL